MTLEEWEKRNNRKQNFWTKERHFPKPVIVVIICVGLFVCRTPITTVFTTYIIPQIRPTPVAGAKPIFTYPEEIPFPSNGTINITGDEDAIAGFEINAENANTYIYIKLKDLSNNNQNIYIYLHPNSFTSLKVPLGDYDIYIASGNTWYGENQIFGDLGTYKKLDKALTFNITKTENMSQINGYTLILQTVTGDLTSKPANKDDFK